MTMQDRFDTSPAIRSTTVVAGLGTASTELPLAEQPGRAVIHPRKAPAVNMAPASTKAQTARAAR